MNANFLYKFIAAALVATAVPTVHKGDAINVAAQSVPTNAAPVATFTTADGVTDGQAAAEIVIRAEDKKFIYKDVKIYPSDFTVEQEIYDRRINAPLDKKIELTDVYLQNGADHKTALGVCFPLLIKTVDDVARYVNADPVDSQVKYEGGKFYATKERVGKRLDENRLYGGIYYCLKFGGGGTVKASTVDVMPALTQKELSERLILRSEYKTDYTTSTAARANNVRLALSKFDGVCVQSGQSVSFNGTVGARTRENGFMSAKIIVDGKYTEGIGGGACQASTAVYNAALLSGLQCTANAHSICPSYCPPGLDAMISSNSDLVITNNSGYPVYFSVTNAGGIGKVRIYGAPREYEIRPESVVVKTSVAEEREFVDSDKMYFGEEAVSGDRLMVSPGKDGCESVTYLKYYKNGSLVKRVKIRQNIYKSTPRIIAVAP